MDKNILKKLKEKLEKERASLEQNLEKFAKKNSKLTGDWNAIFPQMNDGNLEEEADEVEEYGNLLPVEHGLELRLKEVSEALKKIGKKSYGKCEKCGKEIEKERLNFYPAAKLCLKCQESDK